MTETSSFRDNQSRDWFLTVTIPAAKRIKQILGVDILNTQEALPQISQNPILLVDVLWMLVRDQALTHQVTDEEFGASLSGQSLGDAAEAFVEALINFSPPQRQKILRSMQSTGRELESLLMGMVETKIPAALAAAREATSGRPSAGSQESQDTSQPAA